jgi:hypothetical protein
MSAANGGSDEVVTMLLGRGADPDRIIGGGNTALVSAIQGGVLTTIETLANVTSRDLGGALSWIALYGLEVTGSVLQLVERARCDSEAIMKGLVASCEFGALELLNALLMSITSPNYSDAIQHKLLESAIMSDCALTCAVVLCNLITSPVPEAIINIARQRGNCRVLQLLTGASETEQEAKFKMVRDNMETANVYNKIPKNRERTRLC